MSDHRLEVQLSGGQQRLHLKPRLEHLAAIDALHRGAFENNVAGKIKLEWARGDAEQRSAAAGAQQRETQPHGLGMTRHFEQNVDAGAPCGFENLFLHVIGRGIEGKVRAHLKSHAPAMRVYLRGEHARRSARFGHRNREQPNRATAGDGDGFRGNRPRQHRVHRVAQRVEQRSVVVRDRRRELPDIRFGNDGIAGESAVGVHAQDADVLAHMSQSEFVPRNQRRMNAPLGPRIPVVDVQIGSADTRGLHAHQHFAGTGAGNRYLAQFDAGRGLGLHNGLHGGGHKRGPSLKRQTYKSINHRRVVERCRELKHGEEEVCDAMGN